MEKGDNKLFLEILPSINIKEEDILNNKSFIDDYFEKFGLDAYNSWGPSNYSKSLSCYKFKFNEFKDYAWFLRRGIYYKILEEDFCDEFFLEFIKLNLNEKELEELAQALEFKSEYLNFILLLKEDREKIKKRMKSGSFYISKKMVDKYRIFFERYFIIRKDGEQTNKGFGPLIKSGLILK